MRTQTTALAIFLGSFLLFGVQPMLSRTLLPSFGGSASVWTCCLAAYQVLLLAGYGYAHWLAAKGLRPARRLHLGLLAAAALWLFGVAACRSALKDALGTSPLPAAELLLCVLLFVGLPYVLLAANSTLLQAWLARERAAEPARAREVYALYAVSNFGSLLGLLLYPLVLEPRVSLDAQWYGLAAGVLLHTALVARLTAGAADGVPAPPASAAAADPGPPPAAAPLPARLAQPWLWFGLPALSAFLLNAVTTHLSSDVMPIPLLWALLLAAFLLSYIVGFSALGERGLPLWSVLAALTLLAAACLQRADASRAPLPHLASGVATVLVCGACLHAWLYRIRPEAARLTPFYLRIAAGGAAGGLCASLLAPALFDHVLEYPLALALTAALVAWQACVRAGRTRALAPAALTLVLVAALGLLAESAYAYRSRGLFFGRNFYGCLRLLVGSSRLEDGTERPVLQMVHDATLHGAQCLDPDRRRAPTTYYGERAGGLCLLAHEKRGRGEPMRVALVGLGVGTLACYGRTNDLYRFFEINPMVADLASNAEIFTFLSGSQARVETVPGDARKRLREEQARGEPTYDVVVVDAYAGDAVPLHLATREAFALYLDRLAPDGILALHISNWHMDLLPLCKAVAREWNLQATGIASQAGGLLCAANWVFLSRQPQRYPAPGARQVDWSRVRTFSLPSDDQGNLLGLMTLGAGDRPSARGAAAPR